MTGPSSEDISICPLFGGISNECCAVFVRELIEHNLQTGEQVYGEGDEAHSLYLVASGTLEVLKPSLAPDRALVILGPGDFFGDVSFIDMQPRSATVRAVGPCTLWSLDYAVLRRAYETDLKCYTLVVMNIAREMSRRLRRADHGWQPPKRSGDSKPRSA